MRGNKQHEVDMAQNGIENIDLLVMNLYPFEHAVGTGATFEDCIENIDIGGPAMMRSAAKNHAYVTVLSCPSQYTNLMEQMDATDGCSVLASRREFAGAAFSTSASYDAAISAYFAGDGVTQSTTQRSYKLHHHLKYGCNPHQVPAAVYGSDNNGLPFEVR